MKKSKYQEWTKEQVIKELERITKQTGTLGIVWEEQPEDVDEILKKKFPILIEDKKKRIINDESLPFHSIIEGDNLHTLSVLQYTHKDKIDLIYIDPPYNTGAENWMYNNNYVDKDDEYRHSKWLSFMNRRLRLAKKLLKKDGVLVCAIDENEIAHLMLLLEQIFKAHDVYPIAIVHNPGGKQGKNISFCHEYAVFVLPKNQEKIFENTLLEEGEWEKFSDWGGDSDRTKGNTFYPIVVKDNEVVGIGEVSEESYHPESPNVEQPKGEIYFYPIDQNGKEKKWRNERKKAEELMTRGRLRVRQRANGKLFVREDGYKEIEHLKTEVRTKSFWKSKKYDSSTYGTKVLKNILKDCKFEYPKSIHITQDCLDIILRNKKDAIVLDFFAGSGTTGHAIMELNKIDNGTRQFILCSNNEEHKLFVQKIPSKVTYPRIKKLINGYTGVVDKKKYSGLGGNLKYYKVAVENFVEKGTTDAHKKKYAEELADLICFKEQTYEEVKNTDDYKIYKSDRRFVVIIFNPLSISKVKKEIEKIDKKVKLYVFSRTEEYFEDELDRLENIDGLPENFPNPQIRSLNMKSYLLIPLCS